MVEFVRGALDSGHPSEMLSLVGVMVKMFLPHEFSYPRHGERIDPNPHIDAIAGMPLPEYTALLAVFAEMAAGDADLQGRCRNEVAFRSDALPLWIRELSKLEVYRAVRVVDATIASTLVVSRATVYRVLAQDIESQPDAPGGAPIGTPGAGLVLPAPLLSLTCRGLRRSLVPLGGSVSHPPQYRFR